MRVMLSANAVLHLGQRDDLFHYHFADGYGIY